jgi:pseudouridylate synthase
VTEIHCSDEVADALADKRPILALESTIIAHGLPRPQNLEAALGWEAQVRAAGVTPATVAIIDGVPCVGLEPDQLERVATTDIPKASVREIPVLMGRKASGATTVASTAFLAERAGVRVFATGGLGGVHRGASETFDESADLSVLATTPITVVSAGVKSILDIGATLERLETLSVPVVGFGTSVFPAFWLRESAFSLEWSVESPTEIASMMAARDSLGMRQGIIVANPVPAHQQWDPTRHDRLLDQALAEAEIQGIRGNDVTPFLLAHVLEHSGGESLRVNLDLVTNNVAVASEVALAWAQKS